MYFFTKNEILKGHLADSGSEVFRNALKVKLLIVGFDKRLAVNAFRQRTVAYLKIVINPSELASQAKRREFSLRE